jgi:hypothetical protein
VFVKHQNVLTIVEVAFCLCFCMLLSFACLCLEKPPLYLVVIAVVAAITSRGIWGVCITLNKATAAASKLHPSTVVC